MWHVCLLGLLSTTTRPLRTTATTTTTTSTASPTTPKLTTRSTTTSSSSKTTSSGKPQSSSATVLTTSAVNSTVFKSVSSIRPLHGPAAGGTRISISGHLINTSTVRAVLIGSYRLIPDGSNSTSTISADSITVTTPAVNETLQRHLPIAVELSDGFILTTNFSFEYRDNPTFVDIQPREHLLVGGTLVTVNGSSLDSVAAPRVTVTLVITRFINVTVTSTSAPCWFPADADAGGYEMLCRMPPVELPPDFDSQQNTSIRNISETSGVAVYYGPNGRDRADVYVGLELDGLTTYSNISAVKPDIEMMFYGQPTISCEDKEMHFNPRKDEIISIKGSNLARGCQLVDFNITIGDGVCAGYYLTDSEVTCRPPTKRPPANRNNPSCANQLLSVDLLIGNAVYHCSCLRYEDSADDIPLILGLAVGLGGPLVLVALIAGVGVIVVRRHRKQTVRKGTTINAWDSVRRPTSEMVVETSPENDCANIICPTDAGQPPKTAKKPPPVPIKLINGQKAKHEYVNKQISEVTTTFTSTDAEQPPKPTKKLPPVPPGKLRDASDVPAASEATVENGVLSIGDRTVNAHFVRIFRTDTLRPSVNSSDHIKATKKLPPKPTKQTSDVDDAMEVSVGGGLFVNQSELCETVDANSTHTNPDQDYEKLTPMWKRQPNLYQLLPVNRQL